MIFHMLTQLTYQDGLNNAVVVDLKYACCFAPQSLPFVGGRIGSQKQTADCILRLPEFTIFVMRRRRGANLEWHANSGSNQEEHALGGTALCTMWYMCTF